MQTAISEQRLTDPEVRIAEGVLRACVHCGFCNATCPTYPILGSELEGPRGRIYLMKALLEDRIPLNAKTVAHLDHCLSCFACETTCPSGVRYSRLIDPARALIERSYRRPLLERLRRKGLALLLPYPARFRALLRLGTLAKPLLALAAPLLPRALGGALALVPWRLPARSALTARPLHPAQGARRARVALLTGCAQQVLGPHINDATLRLLTRIGCEVALPAGVGCCGALVFHMGNRADSLPHMRANIDRWHEEMRRGGLDAIVINTSGCGTVVKDYGHIFQDDPLYRDKAAQVSAIVKDVAEWVHALGVPPALLRAAEGLSPGPPLRVAYHDACSLQHAQRVRAAPRELLKAAGFTVLEVPQAHLCCGSAGTYNLLQPTIAGELGRQKAQAIAQVAPQAVAAGNIGCMEQIAQHSGVPVLHTVELLDWATGGPKPAALAGLPGGH
jgi:glycolate oxidase iron-sulfur subunit